MSAFTLWRLKGDFSPVPVSGPRRLGAEIADTVPAVLDVHADPYAAGNHGEPPGERLDLQRQATERHDAAEADRDVTHAEQRRSAG